MPVSTEWGASLTFPITGSSKSRRSSTPTRCWTAATPRSRAGVARRRPGKRSSRRNGPSTARRRKKADDRAGYPGRRAGADRAGGGGRPRFDVIHLGLGEDGHTASLFPGSPALKEGRALIAQVHDAPKPPPDRLTLTLPVLNAARAVLFMVQGTSKRQALARVLRRDPALPASQVQPLEGELHFIVDRAAAAI